MIIERRSRLTGKTSTMDLPVTEDQIAAFERGVMVQDAFPHLPAAEREFILTGTTPEEWDAVLSTKEEDDG